MRARLARHAVILSLVVAAVAAGGVARWSGSAGAVQAPVPAGVALR